MEEKRQGYEFVLGFVAILISLSIFNQKLEQVHFNLGTIYFSLSDYFFYALLGFLFFLYLYTVEWAFRHTVIGQHKILDIILKFARYGFAFLIISPVILIFIWLISKLPTIQINVNPSIKEAISVFIALLVGSAVASMSVLMTNRKARLEKRIAKDLYKVEEEALFLEVEFLLKEGHSAQSVFGAFRLLEMYLYRLLEIKGVRVQKKSFYYSLETAYKMGLISENELRKIAHINEMRKAAVHHGREVTQEQAENVISFVRLFRSKYSESLSEEN